MVARAAVVTRSSSLVALWRRRLGCCVSTVEQGLGTLLPTSRVGL